MYALALCALNGGKGSHDVDKEGGYAQGCCPDEGHLLMAAVCLVPLKAGNDVEDYGKDNDDKDDKKWYDQAIGIELLIYQLEWRQ